MIAAYGDPAAFLAWVRTGVPMSKPLRPLAWLRFAAALLLGLATVTAQAAPTKAAVFPFQFDDTSPEPPQPAELVRLRKIDAQLQQLLAASGRYVLVSTAPVSAQAKAQALNSCQACAVSLARQLGANVAIVGWVQKVSNLILDINVVIRAVPSGQILAFGGVSIRGNTDASWSRGLESLVTHQLLVGR